MGNALRSRKEALNAVPKVGKRFQSWLPYHTKPIDAFVIICFIGYAFYELYKNDFSLLNNDPNRFIYTIDNPPPSTFEQLKKKYQEGKLFESRFQEILMGRRQRDPTQNKTRGPGKKAKRQQDFEMPSKWKDELNEGKSLSSRARKRQKMREVTQNLVAKKAKQEVEVISDKIDDDDHDDTGGLKLLSDESDDSAMEDDFGDDLSSDGEERAAIKQRVLDEMENADSSGDSEDDEDESEDKLLAIEKKTKNLQKKRAAIDKAIKDEDIQTNIQESETFVLPSGQEIEKNAIPSGGLEVVQQRIKDIIAILSDFANKRDPNRTGVTQNFEKLVIFMCKYASKDEFRKRKDYIKVLCKDLCTYYSYNEFLMAKFIDMFPLNELIEFLEANEVQRPITIRTNTLKARRRDLAQALIGRGVNLDPIGNWTKVGLVVYDSTVPIGATPEYLAGHYILQGASSFLPVMALAPQPGEKVLDMCSAPGGKTSYIAQLMKNTGFIFANDVNKDRIRAVVGNLHRMGVSNSIISNYDGRSFPTIMGNFSRVLLDAPCSGTGVIAKDPSIKSSKAEEDIKRCSHLQKELILSAIDSVNAQADNGGYVVYCTCSVLVEENEDVVEYALKRRNVKLVQTGLEMGSEGFTRFRNFRFHPTMKHTKRVYPHTHNMDGFFIAKMKKFSNTIPVFKETEGENTVEVTTDDDDAKAENSENKETATKKPIVNKSQKLTMKRLKKYQKKKHKPGALVRPVSGIKEKKRNITKYIESKSGKKEESAKTTSEKAQKSKSMGSKNKVAKKKGLKKPKTEKPVRSEPSAKDNVSKQVKSPQQAKVSHDKENLTKINGHTPGPAANEKQARTKKKQRLSMKDIVKMRQNLLDD